MSERNGIEIDYCPQCRGVWLDRGELDKIIERSVAPAAQAAPAAQQMPPQATQNGYPGGYDPRYNGGYGGGHHGNKNKRRGWLGELFD